MPVLPYCVVLANEGPGDDLTGVGGAPIERLLVEGLCVYYSQHPQTKEWVLSPEALKTSALEFYRVIHSVFRNSPVVPFRFPALLADEGQLREHLSGKAAQYKDFLESTRGMVQMEVQALLPVPASQKREAPKSGTEYLRQQQTRGREIEEIAAAIQGKVQDLAVEWRRKQTAEHLRLYAKAPASRSQEFRERLKGEAKALGLKVSGPWPLSEFLPE